MHTALMNTILPADQEITISAISPATLSLHNSGDYSKYESETSQPNWLDLQRLHELDNKDLA